MEKRINKKPYIVAITGASGVRYGIRLISVLKSMKVAVEAIVTKTARKVALVEEGIADLLAYLRDLGVKVYDEDDLNAPYASSSNPVEAVIIAPCSIKTLAMISNGISMNLVTRVALNALRTRRPLVIVVRETPLGVIEIENMLKAAKAGAIILPAAPAFYHNPKTINDLVDFIVGKILDVIGIDHNLYKRWRP